MTYLIEPYFLVVVLIISFVLGFIALGFIVGESRMDFIVNKQKTKIKDLESEINAHGF